MSNNLEHINQLQHQLDLLLKKHELFSEEIRQLDREIKILRAIEVDEKFDVQSHNSIIENFEPEPIQPAKEKIPEAILQLNNPSLENISEPAAAVKKPRDTSALEKFIGENLINKIGILITVIGVGIGAKYSIDNDLISPLTRIILGYLSGVALLGIGIKLKQTA